MRRLIKIFIVSFAVIAALDLSVYLGAKYYLKKYNVSYSDFDFGFPAQVNLKNLSYHNNNGVKILISDLNISLSVKSLIKGKAVIRNLFIDGADISIINSGVKAEAEAEKANSIDLPAFLAYDVSLNNSRLELINGRDSLELNLKGMNVTSLSSAGFLIADSLFLNNLDVCYISGNQNVKDSDNEAFTFNAIPSFELAFADLNNCSFLYSDSSNHHKISSLDFRFSGLKSSELMNFKVDRLAFNYQDSIDMEIILGNGVLNEEFKTSLEDISINVPGLKLDLPHLDIDASDGLKGNFSVNDSYISFGLLRSIYPSSSSFLDQDIPSDSLISFRGAISAGRSYLNLESFYLAFFHGSSMLISGRVNWPVGIDQLNIDLDLGPVVTTGRHLGTILKKASYQGYYNLPEWLTGRIKITGSPDNIEIGGTVNTSKGDLIVNTNFRSGRNISHSYWVSVKADSLIINDIVKNVPLNLPYAYLNLNLEGNPGSNGNKKYFKIDLESARFAVDTNEINNLHLFYSSDSYSDSVYAGINDELVSLNLDFVRPPLSKEMFLNGKIEKLKFHDLIPVMPSGSFSSILKGKIQSDDSEMDASIGFSSISFSRDSDQIAIPDFNFRLQSGTESLKLNLNSGSGNFIEASTGKKFPPFRLPLSEWLTDWPETTARARFNPDSTLLRRLTGHNVSIDIDHLLLKKDDSNWITELNIPHISYDSISADGISLNIISTKDKINGSFDLEKIINPGITVAPLNFDISYQDSVYYLRMESHLNEGRSRSVLSVEMRDFLKGYQIRLNDADTLIINNSHLTIADNTGLIIDDSLHIIRGDFAVNDKSTLFKVSTKGPDLTFEIDSLKLDNLLSYYLQKENFKGSLNFNGIFNTVSHNAEWQGGFHSLNWDSTYLGAIEFKGRYSVDELFADASYLREESEASIKINKIRNSLNYSARLENIDLGFINTLPLLPPDTKLRGKLKGQMSGEMGERNYADGILITESVKLNLPEVNTGIELDNDTLFFTEKELTFRNFKVKDAKANDLTVNGIIHFDPDANFDLTVQSEKFRLLHNTEHTSAVTGNLDVAADLKIKGNPGDLTVSGVFKTLPEARIDYVLPESYKLVDASQIVTFTDFTKGTDSYTITDSKSDKKLNLNVDLEISETLIRVVLDEVSQQYVRLRGSGRLNLREGTANKPFLFGSIESSSGDAFISPPAIPDLMLVIEKVNVSWKGMIDEPEITLKGFKEVKANPKGLNPQFSNSQGIESFKVFLILDQVTLSHFDIVFDLEGASSETNSYLRSLPSDARQALAINLLVFGKFGTEETSKNAVADQVTAKLNELARRNLKNADLSFSTVSYKDGTSTGAEKERTDFSYSLSKRFINNRLTFSVGGSVGLYMEDVTEPPPSSLIGDIALSYKIKEQPSVSMKASRKDVYRGVIDGDVTEASAGIFYQKSYPRFRDFIRKEKTDSVK